MTGTASSGAHEPLRTRPPATVLVVDGSDGELEIEASARGVGLLVRLSCSCSAEAPFTPSYMKYITNERLKIHWLLLRQQRLGVPEVEAERSRSVHASATCRLSEASASITAERRGRAIAHWCVRSSAFREPKPARTL